LVKNWIYHDSQDLFYRNPFGAVPCNQIVNLKVKLQNLNNVEKVVVNLWRDGEGSKDLTMGRVYGEEGIYSVSVSLPSISGLVWYYFIVTSNGQNYYYGNNQNEFGGLGEISEGIPLPFQITVYKKELLPPTWFQNSVIYQIFVDRFYNGNKNGIVVNAKKNSLIHAHWDNDPIYIKDEKTGQIARWDFFGGNLLGVKNKLGYIKGLGVNVIYFNPIFEAQSNHKYDTGDFHKIDPMYGDEKLFRELVKEAKELGIFIILDGVFSHTGCDSIYFNKEGNYNSIGAFQSKKSSYYSWYHFDEFPHKYDCWWGIDLLPNVDELDPSFQNFILYSPDSVVKHWQKTGIMGWRLDVADELPDSFIKRFKKVVREQEPNSVLIGEVWEDASNKVSYGKRREYFWGEELDSVMNYPFRQIVIDFLLEKINSQTVHLHLMSLYENYPIHNFYSLMNLLGSHDVPRILTIFQDALINIDGIKKKQEIAIKQLKLAILWQMTFPGVPSIYYGDEVGLEGGNDPLNRRGFPWERGNNELYEWVQKMIIIRNQYDVLRTGHWISLAVEQDIYGFIRLIKNGIDALGVRKNPSISIILLNRNNSSERLVILDVSQYIDTDEFINLIDPTDNMRIEQGLLECSLKPLEGKVWIKKQSHNT